jgi:hypothetical protein
MSTYQPYTYLVGWSTVNKYYYGVRYAKDCNPNDFWVSYFTSSRYVKELRKNLGEPDLIQIRKIFNKANDAILWEHKVLRRLNVVKNPHWLNKYDGKAFPVEKPVGHQVGSRNSMYGRKRPDIVEYNKTRIHPLLGKRRPEHALLMKTNNPMKGISIPFWTNESINVRQYECPGEGWRRGFVRKKKKF